MTWTSGRFLHPLAFDFIRNLFFNFIVCVGLFHFPVRFNSLQFELQVYVCSLRCSSKTPDSNIQVLAVGHVVIRLLVTCVSVTFLRHVQRFE